MQLAPAHRTVFDLVALGAPLLLAGCSGGQGTAPKAIPVYADLPDPEELDVINPLNPTTPEPGVNCDWEQRIYKHGSEAFPGLTDKFGSFVGQAIQGASIYNAIPNPIIAPRGGGTIIIPFASGSNTTSVQLAEVTKSTVVDAINAIIAEQPTTFPADLNVSVEYLESGDELQVQMQANAAYMGLFESEASFNWKESWKFSRFLVKLEQVYYTVDFERPAQLDDFWAPNLSAEQVSNQIYAGNPACYIDTVSYGRVFYLLMQAEETAEAMEGTLNANFGAFGFGASLGGELGFFANAKNLEVFVYAYGGDQKEVLDSLDKFSDLKQLLASLASASDLKTGKPLSYTVRSVGTDQLVKNAVFADYQYATCTLPGVCIPKPISPLGSKVDNGCIDSGFSITFNWSKVDCAEEYRLRLYNPQGVLVKEVISKTNSTKVTWPQGFVDATGWKWDVTAKQFGVWEEPSPKVSFSLEPINTDCSEVGVWLFTHPNQQGGSIFIPYVADKLINLETISGWDDEVDSIDLKQIPWVEFWEHPPTVSAGGKKVKLNHDCNTLAEHNFKNNTATMLKFPPNLSGS
jgi:Thiol-activated cytolysin